MKRFLMMLAVSLMVVLLLAGCSNARNNTDSNDNKQLSIVATIYPEYDWVLNILGEKKDNAEVMLLVDNGTDLHSYEPTAKDMVKIAKCDVFIYVGGESDQWVEDALKQATNKNMQRLGIKCAVQVSREDTGTDCADIGCHGNCSSCDIDHSKK